MRSCVKKMGPFDPRRTAIAMPMYKGRPSKSTREEKHRSKRRFVLFCHSGIASEDSSIRAAPNMEFIFTEPRSMSRTSGIVLMQMLLFSSSAIRLFVFSCSLLSMAMMTSSILRSVMIFLRSMLWPKCGMSFSKGGFFSSSLVVMNPSILWPIDLGIFSSSL